MKKSRKSFLLAMMAILVAAGLAGCGRGNSASGQQTENANGQTDQLAQAQTEDAEKDSVIVVMVHPQNQRQVLTRFMAGAQGNMFMNR